MSVSSARPHRRTANHTWVAWALLLVGIAGVTILSLRRAAVIPRPEEHAPQQPAPAQSGTMLPESSQSESATESLERAEALPQPKHVSAPFDSNGQHGPSARFFRERLTTETEADGSEWQSGFPPLLENVAPAITTSRRLVWVLPDQTAIIYDRDADRYREIRELSPDEISMMNDLDRLQSIEPLDLTPDLSPVGKP